MVQLDPFISLGLILIGVGGTIFLVFRLLLRQAPGIRRSPTPPNIAQTKQGPTLSSLNPAPPADAVLVVQAGGKIISLNDQAYQLFHLSDRSMPNLERLAHRIRPAEVFLALCTQESQAQLIFEGRTIEGSSHRLASTSGDLYLLALRSPEIGSSLPGTAVDPGSKSLQTIAEITRSISSSLDLKVVVQSVLENLEKILPVDLIEINLIEADTDALTAYHLTGSQGTERQLEQSSARFTSGSGYTETLINNRQALFLADVDQQKELDPAAYSSLKNTAAYIGIPLLIENELIGALEFSSFTANAFRQGDFDLIRLLSGQAAVAIHNAILYKEEQRQNADLARLAQFSQAFGVLRDPKELFERLIKSISPLISVNILGFFIYNEDHRTLEGQAPFQGVPGQFMPLYHILLPPKSEIEKLFLNQEVILSDNAMEDPRLADLGLNTLAIAATLRDTILVPLTSSGRLLGYLQASNHLDGSSSFTQEEAHLLTIIANQAAPIIENATLVTQTRQRAQRAEGLRRIASLASSAATLDEILKFSLQELVHLLGAEIGVIFLTDASRGVLHLHQPSAYGMPPDLLQAVPSLSIDDPQFPFSVTGHMRAILSGVLSEEEALLPLYNRMVETLRIVSAIAVPLVVRDQGIGELWIGSFSQNYFDNNDLQVVVTAGGQLAGVVEQSILVTQTDESLRRRVDQLTALTRISRELSGTLDYNFLAQIVYDEALRTSQADCGSVILFDLNRPEPISVKNALGDSSGETLSPLELVAINQLAAIAVDDFTGSAYDAPHVGIESALVIPIVHQQRIAGLINLHATTRGRFDQTAIEITQALAVQVALVIGNAMTYQEQITQGQQLHDQVGILGKLLETSQSLRADQPLEESLNIIAGGIRHSTPFEMVLISVYQLETDDLKRIAQAGFPEQSWNELVALNQPWQKIIPLLKPQFLIGPAYFIPAEKTHPIGAEIHNGVVSPKLDEYPGTAWDPDDSLLLPLLDQEGKPLGLIRLDSPRDGRRPTARSVETVEIFAGQATLSIENHRRLSNLDTQVKHAREELDRTSLALHAALSSLPTMLQKDLQQSIAIQRFSRQMRRIRDGLEIAAVANRQTDIASVIISVGQELLTRMELDFALEAENTSAGPRLFNSTGEIPAGISPDALFGQRNPLRQSLADAEIRLVDELEMHPDWRNNALLTVFETRSFICLPVEINQHVVAAILVIGKNSLPAFSDEDRQIFQQLTRQVSIVLQNLTLLTEARRRLQEMDLILEFSRQLGSLNTSDILNALLKSTLSAIPASSAAMVALYNVKANRLIPQIAEGYSDNASLIEITYPLHSTGQELALPAQIFRQGRARRIDEVNFAQDYNLPVDDLMRYRKATGGRLPVSSLMMPIQAGETSLGLLVLDNFYLPSAFSLESEALATSFTQQTALALENARLYQASEERTIQLQALTTVTGTMTSSLQRADLIASLLDQLELVIPYDTATLWLRQGHELSVAAAKGFTDNDQRLGLSVAVEDSLLLNEMIKTGQPISVKDVRDDPRFPSLVLMERYAWLGIPLIAKGEVMGVIALEKTEADYYSPEHIQAGTTFAGQAAIAMENARLFEESQRRAAELDQRSQRLALLNRLSGELGSTLEGDKILLMSAQEVQEALNCSVVSVVLFDNTGAPRLQLELPRVDPDLPRALPSTPVFDHLKESLGIFSTNNVAAEEDLADLQAFFTSRNTTSLLIVPLITGNDLRGMLLLQTDQVYRFTLPEIELALTISNQTAIAIQNASLYAETRQLTEELELRVRERTEQLSKAHHNTETLLQIITELTASLDMGQVLNRTLGVLNEAIQANESAIYMARQGTLELFFRTGSEADESSLDLSSPDLNQFNLTHTPLPNQTQPPAPATELEIARMVFRLHRSILVDDLAKDGRWQVPEDQPLPYTSILAVPLVLGEEVLGVLLLFNTQVAGFDPAQTSLVEAAARQISVALNNAELFNLIRDQAEHLGGMLREQQVEASRSRAILEAVADGVLVTDAVNTITLYNSSAERILELPSSQVIGQSLELFSGLFGKSGRAWFHTIRTWSSDPMAYQPGESYTSQITLENGQIVANHLAPVFLRSQFLGTVSIFRDITHEVMVDRLKSDFVANVSHELRTPMTSIKGYVEVMLMGASGPLNDQQLHFLEVVKNNAQRLNVLVNDLLDVSRIEAGRITLSFQPLDIGELAQEALNDIQRRSHEDNKPMTFTLETPGNLPEVDGDIERVRQILGNLISNAYNYTPENGQVTVRIQPADTAIQIDVQDNGIGIPQEEHERIFERFNRGEDPLVLETAGTGLGLSIVKNLVEMHHGAIWLSSTGEPGKGSIFSFTLPYHQVID